MDKEQALLSNIRELMFKYGIKSLTMDDIAQNLGISKKTLYQVVDNKADLVHKIVAQTIAHQREGLTCVIENSVNVIDELLQIYKHNSQMFKRINPSLTFELQKYYPQSWKLMENFRQEFIYSCVLRNIERGMESGFYRDDINKSIIAKLYTIRSLEVLNPELFPPQEFSPTVVLREMFIYHIRGIASKKGLEYLGQITFDL